MWKQRINAVLAATTGYELQRAVGPAQRSVRRSPGARRPAAVEGGQGARKPRAGQAAGPKPRKAAAATGAKAGRKRRSEGGPDHISRQTVAQGWETYAGRKRQQPGVGDDWSAPRRIGLDVARSEDVVPYLDQHVFAPYLDSCDAIVEIGSGGGRFTEILLPKCKRLIALDTSQTMLDVLQRRFADQDGLQCVLSDGRGLTGVADESVDAAFSYGVFVHLQHWDIYHYMTELQRALKPGGKAIIQHTNTFSELGWREFEREVPRQLNRHKIYNSLIFNTPEIMREFVTRAGLECVDQITDVVKRDCITLIRKP